LVTAALVVYFKVDLKKVTARFEISKVNLKIVIATPGETFLDLNTRNVLPENFLGYPDYP
jgi:hypothetical protein